MVECCNDVTSVSLGDKRLNQKNSSQRLEDRWLIRWEEGQVMKLKALIHSAEEGGFWAEVPALPGCVSEGETFEEILINIREAAEGWLEVATDRIQPDVKAQVVEIEM